MTTPTLDTNPTPGIPSTQPIPGGSLPANQTEAQTQLAQIAAAQQAADAQQTPPQQDNSGNGWSLNPFQDIGQIWHDVETHTVSPVFHATHWIYSNLVARPFTTALDYSSHEWASGNFSPFQGSEWANQWKESAHVSPGQALVLAFTDDPIESKLGQGFNPAEASQGPGVRFIDPDNPAQMEKFQTWAKGTWSGKISTGSADALIGWYGDPTGHLTKGVKAIKDLTQNPITKADNAAQAAAKLASPKSQKFDQWAVGKPISVLAEHPLIKGSFGRSNPYANQLAALVAGAKTPEEVGLIRRIAYDIDPGVNQGLKALSGDVSTASKALDKLSQTAPDTAVQASNLFMPLEITENWAYTAASDSEKSDWLQKVSQTKARAAQEAVNVDSETAQQLLKLRGSGLSRTASSDLTNRLAEIKGSLKYANTRDVDTMGRFQQAFYNFPVRIYQGLTDRPPGMINHNDDDAIISARSWLNKSSILTPDQKNDFLQRYASASPAQRQHTWRSIENTVYGHVGDAYGIPADTMQRILTTTRSHQQNFIQLARSKAYGSIKLGEDEHAVLPSTNDEIVLHPMYLAQLERGAVPQANLRDLENALEAMSRNPDSVLDTLKNGGARSWDTLKGLLDNVYGLWKPMSLMTGHRSYNHIGDDFLRGVSRLGAMTTIDHAKDGAVNFLRNNYNRLTRNQIARNITGQHETAVAHAKAQWEGLQARAATEKSLGLPPDLRTPVSDIASAKAAYQQLKDLEMDFVQPKHRLGEGTFKIAGSNLPYTEMFGGPNAEYLRWLTSSHPTFNAMVDDGAHALHGAATALRSANFGTIQATEDVARHTRAYVHYVRNQMMSDPVGKMIAGGRDLTDTARWLSNSPQGRAHMKALHIGDPDRHVYEIASDVRKMLPTDEMRDAAVKGKFNSDVIEKAMPNAGTRPEVIAHIGQSLYGGDPLVNWLRRSMDSVMKWTGTMPDDILVRHPFVNAMYKDRLTDSVQRFIATRGRDITLDELAPLQEGAMRGARKDMQNTLYDVSRFNDLGHTLRFISPFFNAWFNALSSWSRLFAENPSLLSRTYQAKRALWNSPFAVNTDTGQQADVNTPWDKTAFVIHMPKALSSSLGGLTSIPIDAKTLISPTYIDAVGNPGFGPVVAVPMNQIVKDHPSLMNDTVVRSMLNNMVDKNSMTQLLPSGMRDVQTLSQLLTGNPADNQQYANTVWSIYQEQMYDYLNGQRVDKPNWTDIQTQAKYLTMVDLVANRLLPLGFKPAPAHSNLINEYRQMQATDGANARQDFYNKYGPAGMVFTQSLSTDPTGIPATVGASVLVKKYRDILQQFPELGSVIVGVNGNGNYDQMAYDWQVAQGLRQRLTPQDAATQASINTGWAQYGQVHAAAMAQLQARGLKSLNDPRARQIKTTVTNFVARLGDPKDPLYNPDWHTSYGAYNQNAYQNRATALLTIAQDPALLGNSTRHDIKALQSYAQLRDTIYAALQKRPNKSINAATNFALAKELDDGVATLMHQPTSFAQLYERYLSKDDFKEPI